LWFVIVLVSLVVLAILLSCIPVELVFRANTRLSPKFSLKLVWFFGLVTRDLRQPSGHGKKKLTEVEQKTESNWFQNIRFTVEILQTRGLLKQLGRFIARTFKRIHVKELVADLKVALENPADTGLLFAFIGPINLLINYFVRYPVKIEPSFVEDSFVSGYFNGSIKLTPIFLLSSTTGLLFSMPALRATKKLVSYRCKSRR